MKITAAQPRPNVVLVEVILDYPGQFDMFEKHFRQMVDAMAEESDAEVKDVTDMSNEEVAEYIVKQKMDQIKEHSEKLFNESSFKTHF